MANTFTTSNSGSWTDARAREVTGKVYENLLTMVAAQIISKERAAKILEHLLYFQRKKALDYFEFQFTDEYGKKTKGLRYKLISSGYAASNDASGGIDFEELSSETQMTFLVKVDKSSPYIAEVDDYTKVWAQGESLIGDGTHFKTYSKDGYGFEQFKIGM